MLNGLDNEYEFVKYLNGKKINELNPLFVDLFDKLYPTEDKNSIIKCWRNHYKQKSDIIISVNNYIRGISIKKGSRNSVHVEPIKEFEIFLKNMNISDESINEYLRYHYADGTLNGTGHYQQSAVDYKKNNQFKIDKLNEELNTDRVIQASVERFILKGNNSQYPIDVLIYGEVNDFLWISKTDIIKYLLRKKDIYSTAVHFSSLTVQPKNRCLNHNSKYYKDRFSIQIKWYNLFDDIIENMYYKELTKSSKAD